MTTSARGAARAAPDRVDDRDADSAVAALSRTLDYANGPQLTSWPVFAITLVIALIVHLLGSPDLPSGHFAARIIAVLMSTAALFAVFAALGPLRARPGHIGRAWLVVAIVAAGAVRGVVLQLMLVALGVTTSLSVAYRLPAGIATSAVAAAIVSGVIGAIGARTARLATAQAVHDGLVDAIRTLDEGIEQRQEQASERIVADLRHQLDVVFGAAVDLDARLRDLADDVVRPLSHALAETVPVPPDFVAVRDVARVRLPDAWRGLRAVDGLNPLWLTAVPVLLVLPPAFAFIGSERMAAFIAVLAGALVAATAALRPVARALTRGRAPLVHATALTAALLLIAAVVIVVERVAGGIEAAHASILYPGFLFLPLIGWGVAVAAASRRAISEADAQIAAETARLRWVTARLAAIHWQQQGDLSRALHGPVQSAIHAAVSQLGRASTDGAELGPVIARQRDALTATIMRLTLPDAQVPDIDATLAVATATWAGIAAVDVGIDEAARAALQSDSVSAGVFVDVVVEAVSNAIRHGGATRVSIQVAAPQEDVVAIVIEDNGAGPHDVSTSGLGMELMRQCSVELDARLADGTFVIRALLPVQAT